MRKIDAIVIGSGQGGVPLAKKLAKSGLQTAIIEKRWIGGTCINDGCTPTKTMIADARTAYVVKNSYNHGIDVRSFSVDLQKIIARKNKVVQMFRDGSQKGLEKTANLEVIFGEAQFTGDKTITITKKDGSTEVLRADKIFINTGAKPSVPKISGLDAIPFYNSTTLLDIDKIPSHLIIVGASYIALEFGQLFRRLGSEVSILEKGDRFLSKEDEDISKAVKEMLEAEGIHIHMQAEAKSVSQSAPEKIQMELSTGTTLQGSHVLIASGRVPQTDRLQADKSGIALDERGYIKVNEKLETNVPGVYALGDVKPGPAFTHVSYNDYIILVNNLLKGRQQTTTDRPLLYCMFTDPELGRVGLNEQQAREKGILFKVATLPMTRVARGIETGQTIGLMKAIINPDTLEILGASILGASGGEIMTILQMAMAGGIKADQVREMMFAHPLFAESLNNLFMTILE